MYQKKIIVLYGARQVGKTTLCKQLISKHNGVYFNAERPNVKQMLEEKNIPLLLASLTGKTFGVIDEAQKVRGIEELLKILIDEYPHIQWIATGSSSFDLANETAEPLTGRKITFTLLPPSLQELSISPLSLSDSLESLLIYGSYPAIALESNFSHKKKLLLELSGDYLYKDVLEFEALKKPNILSKLLQALALQLGSEVSLRELSIMLQTSGETIERYLSLLEKSFVIFPLSAYSKNLRNEIARKKKYYFYDVGIRNALLQNFSPIKLRGDIGALWENFCIIERKKRLQLDEKIKNSYFWRNYQQKEIDYIEEENGALQAFEMKWNTKKTAKLPKDFAVEYGIRHEEFGIISPESAHSFLFKS